jgi:hypothetical protein
VADVDFAIRMRGYRRSSYQNRYASSEYLYTAPVASVERLLARDTVKERLHVDAQGRRVRGCSAVPHSGCSSSRELSVQPGGTRGISHHRFMHPMDEQVNHQHTDMVYQLNMVVHHVYHHSLVVKHMHQVFQENFKHKVSHKNNVKQEEKVNSIRKILFYEYFFLNRFCCCI